MNTFNTFEDIDKWQQQIKTVSNDLRPYVERVKSHETDDACWQELGRKLLMLEETCDDETINGVYSELSVYPEFDEDGDGSEATLHERWEMDAWIKYNAALFNLAKVKYVSLVSQLQEAKG
jgi:hypothetical protein